MIQSIRTLLSDLIDYAGLYPPAKLGMQAAVENYAHYRAGEHEWMLGRFICPVSRLREFSTAAAPLMPGTHGTSGYREHAAGEPWRVSAIIDGALKADLATIAAFNDHHADDDHGQAAIDAVELRPADTASVDEAIETIPDDIYPFFEVAADGDVRGTIAALSGSAAGAKIRTGGVTPEAFPDAVRIASFLAACSAADVPIKATAGLHHPVRSEHPLTYEPGCPRGVMHGFLNVFVTAALVREQHIGEAQAVRVLEETDPKAFHFTDEGVRWNGFVLEDARLALAREAFALSFGSCSFEEPIADLKALGLL
jgi:hypothetical protein